MSLRRSMEQLRPARTPKVALVEQAQNYLRELTISPHYQQKGNFNPYYTLDASIEKAVKEDLPKKIKYVELLFKSVEKGKGTILIDAKGKFGFQIVAKTKSAEIETNFFIRVPKKFVKSHYGMKQRKDSTASSNVNEFLTVYFLQHKSINNQRVKIVNYITNFVTFVPRILLRIIEGIKQHKGGTCKLL